MPLPNVLLPLVRTRRFWADFFWDTDSKVDAYPELAACTVDLPVAGGYRLSLSLDPNLSYFALTFNATGQEPVEIAWDDQAHWHPHVLRWQELELICRTIAIQDGEFPHPGMVMLLLYRFAPICTGDDVDLIVPMLEAAWRQLALFSESEITTFIERGDARDAGFRWRYDEPVGGWCLEQDEDQRVSRGLYTLRSAKNEGFPFGSWRQMLSEAQQVIARANGVAGDSARDFAETGDMGAVPKIVRSLRADNHALLASALGEDPTPARVCWVVETLLGMEVGSVLKRCVRGHCYPRQKHSLMLTLPFRDSERPLPLATSKLIADTLDRVLRDWNLGRTSIIGGSSVQGQGGSYINTNDDLGVRIKGDLERGIRLVRGVLWWARAPESVRLSRNWRDDIPLGLTQPPEKLDALCVQISKLFTFHWGKTKTNYRFDRVPFDQATRNALRTILADVRAAGPDDDGWFTANLSDGGSVQICLRRLDEVPDLDAGTVVVPALSVEAAHLVYRLLSEGELMLLPMAIATSKTVADTVTAPWPIVRVVDSASELHDILMRGPHAWWLNQDGNR